MNQSEIDTINYFKTYGVELEKIPEESNSTPDFITQLNNKTIYIEVKELKENSTEKEILNKLQNKEVVTYNSSNDAKRIRNKIKEANTQLLKKCINGEPGILILQDKRDFFVMGLNMMESIKQAMFGDREIWRTMPHHTNNYISKISSDKFGLNKKLRIDTNTIISAVALLIKNSSTNELSLHLFHNPFCKNSLEKHLFQSSNTYKEYVITNTKNYTNFSKI